MPGSNYDGLSVVSSLYSSI